MATLRVQKTTSSVRVSTGRNAMVQWVKERTMKYEGVSVRNLNKSFQDGLAFAALVHSYKPDLIDFESFKKEDKQENLTKVFAIAKEHLGAPDLLDPEDLAEAADDFSIQAYLTELYKIFEKDSSVAVSGLMNKEEATTSQKFSVFNRPPSNPKKKVVTTLAPKKKVTTSLAPRSSLKKSQTAPVLGVKTTPVNASSETPTGTGSGEVDSSRLGRASNLTQMWEHKRVPVDPLSLPPKPKRKMSLADDNPPSIASVQSAPAPVRTPAPTNDGVQKKMTASQLMRQKREENQKKLDAQRAKQEQLRQKKAELEKKKAILRKSQSESARRTNSTVRKSGDGPSIAPAATSSSTGPDDPYSIPKVDQPLPSLATSSQPIKAQSQPIRGRSGGAGGKARHSAPRGGYTITSVGIRQKFQGKSRTVLNPRRATTDRPSRVGRSHQKKVAALKLISNLKEKRRSYREQHPKTNSSTGVDAAEMNSEIEDLELVLLIDNLLQVHTAGLEKSGTSLHRLDKEWRQFEKMANFGALATSGDSSVLFGALIEGQRLFVIYKEKLNKQGCSLEEISKASADLKTAIHDVVNLLIEGPEPSIPVDPIPSIARRASGQGKLIDRLQAEVFELKQEKREYQAQVGELEKKMATQQNAVISSSEANMEELMSIKRDADEERESYERVILSYDKEIEEYKSLIDEQAKSIETLSENLDLQSEKNDELEAKLSVGGTEEKKGEEDLSTQLVEARKEVSEYKRKLEKKNEQLEQVSAELAKGASQLEVESYDLQLREAQDDVHDLRVSLEEALANKSVLEESSQLFKSEVATQRSETEQKLRKLEESNAHLKDMLEEQKKQMVEFEDVKSGIEAKLAEKAQVIKKLTELQQQLKASESQSQATAKNATAAHQRAVKVMNTEFDKLNNQNEALKGALRSGANSPSSASETLKLKKLLSEARARIHGLQFQLIHGSANIIENPLRYEENEPVRNTLTVCMRKLEIPPNLREEVLEFWIDQLGGEYCSTTARIRDLANSSGWKEVTLSKDKAKNLLIKAVIESILKKRSDLAERREAEAIAKQKQQQQQQQQNQLEAQRRQHQQQQLKGKAAGQRGLTIRAMRADEQRRQRITLNTEALSPQGRQLIGGSTPTSPISSPRGSATPPNQPIRRRGIPMHSRQRRHLSQRSNARQAARRSRTEQRVCSDCQIQLVRDVNATKSEMMKVSPHCIDCLKIHAARGLLNKARQQPSQERTRRRSYAPPPSLSRQY